MTKQEKTLTIYEATLKLINKENNFDRDNSKLVITKQSTIAKQFSFEYKIGLSSYDLALISNNKITKRSESLMYDSSNSTYLI